jgi:hypothetical protein
MRSSTRSRAALVIAATATTAVLTAASGAQPATALPTTVPPVLSRTSAVVSAQALPTVQIDGVVWTQVMVGNTVYAGGSFDSARPAGAAAGTSTTARKNLLAYDLTTGKLNTAFKPASLNGQVKALAVSPDQKTVFAGGDFTLVGQTTRLRFAAFDARTGALRSMRPAFNARINALTVAGTTVYAGGSFSKVGTKARSRLAAVAVSNGSLRTWAPQASGIVNALVATPDKKKIVVGGSLAKIGSTTVRGMGAVDAVTGKSRAWKINAVVRDYGLKSAILSLSADADTVYGTGMATGGGNFEGAFAASPVDGSIKWLQDCHGDSYGVAPLGNTVYVVGHAHHCVNIGGFTDTKPRKAWYRALAMTKTARGTVARNSQSGVNYGDFAGQPAPSLYNWFPELAPGTYTGMTQSAWSVVGNTRYISAAGEFLKVNGVPQQGIVRFATSAVTPSREGPRLADASVAPQVVEEGNGSARVSWLSNVDRDDRTLRYTLLRDGVALHTARLSAPFWARRTATFLDTGLVAGTTYRYRVRATDASGNTRVGLETPFTAGVVPSASPTPTAPPSAGAAGG